VLSAHPGEVQELIEVPVPYPRNPGQFITPEFLATKARLEELIHKGAAHDADEDEGTYKMVTRLTDVTDDVD
jgi:NitT/TauT family transport system ATP-binding protein